MHHLSTEYRSPTGKAALAKNLAASISIRQVYGRIAIITNRPEELLVAIKKAWISLERELQYEYSHTLDASRKSMLMSRLRYMQFCTFTATPPEEESREQVQIATVKQFLAWPPGCATMYITYRVDSTDLHLVTSWMPRYGLVVMYQLPKERKK